VTHNDLKELALMDPEIRAEYQRLKPLSDESFLAEGDDDDN